MIHVEVNIEVAEADLNTAINYLRNEMPSMRELPGNLGCRVLHDAIEGGMIALHHQWRDFESFDGYRTGPILTKVGAVLKPMMISAPRTMVYEAKLID